MKMKTSDWIEKERRLNVFYNGTISQDERLLIWKLSIHWELFIQDYPDVALLPPIAQLQHFEQRFIHAIAEIDAKDPPEITIADLPVETDDKITATADGDQQWLFVA
jgi:hypothetical protein